MILMFFTYMLVPSLLQNNIIYSFISSYSAYVVGFPIILIIFRVLPATKIKKTKMTLKQSIFSIAIGYAIVLMSNYAGLIFTYFISLIKSDNVINPMVEQINNESLIYILIHTVILTPLFEELIFRKLIIDRIIKYGELACVIFSGIAFALFHCNFNQFIYAFAAGMFFAFIYVKTGQIKYTITIHMIINFLGSALGCIVINFFNNGSVYANTINILYNVLLPLFAIFGILVLIKSIKKIKFEQPKISLSTSDKINVMYINSGMLWFVTLCTFFILIMLII